MAKAKSTRRLRVTLLKSAYGRKPGHAECVRGLGLRRRHQTVEVIDTPEKEVRARSMGIDQPRKVYTSADLASGRRLVFAATGVTEGALMKGVRFFGEGCRTSSVVMRTAPHRVQFIDTIHVKEQAGRRGLRF